MNTILPQSNNDVNGNALKIAFLGTPDFALPTLERLADSEYRPVAVGCAPDKPVGRKQILTPPPTKALAQKYNIPVFQPQNKKELTEQIALLKPDLIVSAAYGIIIPKEVLDTPRYGCLNIHPSLLPKYRGPSPIQYTILNGDVETGVTIFKMDEGVDTGPIVATSNWPITNSQITTPELSKILADLGAELLLETLPDWIAGKIIPKSQNDSLATYTKILKKEDGRLDWQKSAAAIERQIRAFAPWPGSHTRIMNYESRIMDLKIIEANFSDKTVGKSPGTIFLTDNDKLLIQTGNGSLVVKTLQLEGGKPTDAQSFLHGHKEIIGQILN